eukprot:TRINITY_DN16619_c0_g1_i2.p1 TRINITY_DN16619_c0_g1~~TRINITY_DN16619_c0_g1_i2.p1  ORF type:complete len:331 (-),score=34.93 TRINITY_DN16619_c0_g1_i2:504-1433(-)
MTSAVVVALSMKGPSTVAENLVNLLPEVLGVAGVAGQELPGNRHVDHNACPVEVEEDDDLAEQIYDFITRQLPALEACDAVSFVLLIHGHSDRLHWNYAGLTAHKYKRLHDNIVVTLGKYQRSSLVVLINTCNAYAAVEGFSEQGTSEQGTPTIPTVQLLACDRYLEVCEVYSLVYCFLRALAELTTESSPSVVPLPMVVEWLQDPTRCPSPHRILTSKDTWRVEEIALPLNREALVRLHDGLPTAPEQAYCLPGARTSPCGDATNTRQLVQGPRCKGRGGPGARGPARPHRTGRAVSARGSHRASHLC